MREGLAAYAPCNHEIEHVAFAWHAKAAHEADYAGRRCACSQRLRLLLPPPGADAAAATGFGSKLRATLRKLTLEPSVLVWANRYLSLRPPPPHVAVLLDRTQQPAGYVALPLSEELSEDVSEDGKGARRSPAPLQPHEGGAGVQVIYPCGHAGAEEHFILQTLLGACSPTRHCLFPLVQAAARPLQNTRRAHPASLLVKHPPAGPMATRAFREASHVSRLPFPPAAPRRSPLATSPSSRRWWCLAPCLSCSAASSHLPTG